MGLFDRKRIESEPPAPAPSPQPAPAAERKEPAPQKKAAPEKAPEKVAARPAAQPEPAKTGYGIQNAIELMRQLPSDNVNLVVEVVKKTLESLQVDIPAIIADAERKHARIDDRVTKLQAEIREYEEEIAARRDEIKALTADRDETQSVKERLDLALKLAVPARPATTIGSTMAKPAAKDLPAPGEVEDAASSSSWGSTKASGTLGSGKPS